MYEQTWVNSLEKRRELNHQSKIRCGRRERCGKAEGVHFRFELDDDDVAFVYIYELQVNKR